MNIIQETLVNISYISQLKNIFNIVYIKMYILYLDFPIFKNCAILSFMYFSWLLKTSKIEQFKLVEKTDLRTV